MVHLQLLAQICSCSFCDLMDQVEILKMEGYVSGLEDEPEGEESPTHWALELKNQLEVAPDGALREKPKNTFGKGLGLEEAQALSAHPDIAYKDLGWIHAQMLQELGHRRGCAAEPDDDPTYQNPFAEPDDDPEPEANSQPKKAKAKPEKTKAMPKGKAHPKGKAKTKAKAKAKSKGKAKAKGTAKPKPTSKAKTKKKPKTQGKAKTKAKAEVAQWKVYKHCQGFARSSLQ